MMGMGERIIALRTAKLLSQRQLAKLVGVSQASMSRIELGEATNIRATTLAALSKVLDVSAQWIQHGTGPIPVPVPVTIDHTEVLAIYDHLNEPHRQAWMTTGRALLSSQDDVPAIVSPPGAKRPVTN